MKTNQTLTRRMGNFDVFQRTHDGMFNAKQFTDDFNAFYKCDVNYNDFFEEEMDFLMLLGSTQKSEYLPFASFVHFVSWIYPPLMMYAYTLSCEDGFSGFVQNNIKIDNHRHLIDTYSQLKSKACLNKNPLNIETYLIKDASSGYIKIGKSADILTRFKSLRTGNPGIKLIMVIDRNVETELHQKYECKNLEGEWFNLSDNDLIDIYAKYIKK